MRSLFIAAAAAVMTIAASSAQARVVCHYDLPGTFIGAQHCFDYQPLPLSSSRVRSDKGGHKAR